MRPQPPWALGTTSCRPDPIRSLKGEARRRDGGRCVRACTAAALEPPSIGCTGYSTATAPREKHQQSLLGSEPLRDDQLPYIVSCGFADGSGDFRTEANDARLLVRVQSYRAAGSRLRVSTDHRECSSGFRLRFSCLKQALNRVQCANPSASALALSSSTVQRK